MLNFFKTIIIFFLFFNTEVNAGQLKIKFVPYDADTGNNIPAQLKITANKTITQLDDYTYQISIEQKSGTPPELMFEVKASAGNNYHVREFIASISALNFENDISYYYIFLAPKKNREVPYTRGDVAFARKFIDTKNSIDRSYALLLRMNEEFPNMQESQFKIMYEYNLADSAYNNCTIRFVNTCDIAKKISGNLLDQLKNKNHEYFENENITKSKLETIYYGVDNHLLRMKYRQALWNIDQGRNNDAVADFKNLKSRAKIEPGVYDILQIKEEDIDKFLERIQPTATE